MADSVKIRIEGDDSGYEKTLSEVEKDTKETARKVESEVKKVSKTTQKQMDDCADSVKALNKTAKSLAIGAVALGGAVIGTGVKYNSQIEQYTAGFQTLLGSTEKAEETLAQLREFASKTPFELTDLANASTTLLAFGEDINDLMPDLKMLGDISLGNSEKFKGLALVFGQVKSQGRLMGQDLLQMINQGFNPLQIISEKTGKSVATLKDEMAKGQISFEMVAEAMQIATSAGGKFYNAMDTQSKTLKGQLSTLQDNVADFAGTVSEDLSEHLTNNVLPALIDKVSELKEAWEDGSLQKNLGFAAAAATTFGVAVAGLNIALVVKDMYNLVKGVKDYTAVTKLGTIAQKGFNAAQAATPWGLALTAVAALTAGIATYAAVTNDAAESNENLKNKITKSKEAYNEAVKAANDSVSEKLAEIKVVDTLKGKLYELAEQVNSGKLSEEEATKSRTEFNSVADELNKIIPGVIDNISDETGQIVIQEGAINNLIDAYKRLAKTKAFADAYKEKMDAAAKRVVDAEELVKQAQTEIDSYGSVTIEKYPIKDQRTHRPTGEETTVVTKQDGTIVTTDYAKAEQAIKDAKEELSAANKEFDENATNYSKKIAELGEETKQTGNDFNKVVTGVTATAKAESEKQKTAIKQSLNAVLGIIENSHKLGIISDKEYYDTMAKIRDTYFEEGSEEWQSYTDEIEAYYDDVLTGLAEKMRNFSEKLQDDTHKTFSTTTLYEGDKPTTWTSLANMDSQNAKLEEYLYFLNEVKKTRGEIPESALADLENMDVDDAITFLKTMVNASDAEWNNWVEGIEKNKQLAEEISANFYDEELKGNQELINKLVEQWGEIPEDFFAIGEDCASQYGDGFESVLGGILSELRAEIASSLSVGPSSALISVSAGTTGGGNVYNDNRSTTYNLPSDSTRTRIEAEKQNQIYQDHTSTFGG